MKNKIIIFGAVFAVFLMLMSPSISAGMLDEEEPSTTPEIDEVDDGQDGDEPTGLFFCTLWVWAYVVIPPPQACRMPYHFAHIKLEDLTDHSIRYGITGFFGLKIFYGLQIGHSYKISARYDDSVEEFIYDAGNYESVDLCMGGSCR